MIHPFARPVPRSPLLTREIDNRHRNGGDCPCRGCRITYVSPCLRCGHDAPWTTQRSDERTTTTYACDCGDPPRAEDVQPKRVPIDCWRCGADVTAGFDLINIGARTVAVHRRGELACIPRPRRQEYR